ncbi:hypothetical protein MRB53_015174 [Persea americana]|uniref:Uncharacterized protein n=1 Tax=Persea americana TaxID=3435 RepID=A0ACC2KDJ6_PERAE|nr:hypothetical protein MRB53_015174 [Persea americana]
MMEPAHSSTSMEELMDPPTSSMEMSPSSQSNTSEPLSSSSPNSTPTRKVLYKTGRAQLAICSILDVELFAGHQRSKRPLHYYQQKLSLKQVEAMGEEMKDGGHEHESGNAELCRQVIRMASEQLHHEGRDKFATRR